MNVWFERRMVLMELGFDTYEAYLYSDLWKRIRRAVLDRDRHRCKCGSKATQVHHRRYAKVDLAGSTLKFLVAICRQCHEFGSKDGERVTTPDEANIRIEHRVSAIRARNSGPSQNPGAGNPAGTSSDRRKRRRKKERTKRLAKKVELQALLREMRAPKKKPRPTARPHKLEDGTWDVSTTAGRFRT